MSAPDFYRDTQATFVCANSVISSLASRLISVHIYSGGAEVDKMTHNITAKALELFSCERARVAAAGTACLSLSARVVCMRRIQKQKNRFK
jgi:hypothetical protein